MIKKHSKLQITFLATHSINLATVIEMFTTPTKTNKTKNSSDWEKIRSFLTLNGTSGYRLTLKT